MLTAKIVHKKRSRKGIAGIASLLPGPNAVKVGFPEGKTSAGLVQRAVWNEFGTRGGASGGGWGGPVPERPFMRNAMRSGQDLFETALIGAAIRIIEAAAMGKDANQIAAIKRQNLGKVGIVAQGKIQQEITSLSSPANSPVTVKLKGSSKPLIDSGAMRAAVTWKIKE